MIGEAFWDIGLVQNLPYPLRDQTHRVFVYRPLQFEKRIWYVSITLPASS
jgi:hypothetical protein